MEDKLNIMIDMDEVIVNNRFPQFLEEFLGIANFDKLTGFNRQELLEGQEDKFRSIYQHENLYKTDDCKYIKPMENCEEVLIELNKYYNIYIVTSHTWEKDIFDSDTNKKNKLEYLNHFFPFISSSNIVFTEDKTSFNFDIGIDDRCKNLKSCNTKLLFTEPRNINISDYELNEKGIIRVNNWLDIKNILLKVNKIKKKEM